jgi:hypothetical protein
MSRLDRFLITKSWFSGWPTSTQWCLDKELSDHCPIMLSESVKNWALKPFHMLSCWKYLEGYHSFVREQWKELKVDGCGMFVLKKKLKLIKERLKGWHKEHTQNLGSKIKELKGEIKNLELKNEVTNLTVEEIKTKRELQASPYKLSNLNCNIQW